MANFIIGGWTQNIHYQVPPQFDVIMYGMVTNLTGLTTGTADAPGWSPTKVSAPRNSLATVMWTYGGGGAAPNNMPDSDQGIEQIVQCTKNHYWDGVDFDDESNMNIAMVIDTMQQLTPKQSSYTFSAGWDYNNPNSSTLGAATNQAVKNIAAANCTNRFILMCYGAQMWSMQDIEQNVRPAIERTLANGVARKHIILALTPAGLTDDNLDYFLNTVKHYDIGGLFIWEVDKLPEKALAYISASLTSTAPKSALPC
ncbi:hypothetical protein [Shewanella waksmanii]|uniref:hypothetical protein n=1 Tax=Shewanella waksmanii TaxID=213783 RepID=UPI00048D9853|nr:hypothetical protein [Shewanella waksmanii]